MSRKLRLPSNIRLTKDEENRALYDAAKAAPSVGLVVELGTYRGGSTATLCEAVGSDRVLSIDNFNLGFSRAMIADWLLEKGHEPALLIGDTVSLSRQIQEPVAFLFIDSTHSERHVLNEFRAWKKHLVDSAVVCFHDYDDRHIGVKRAADKLISEGHLQPVENAVSMLVTRYERI